MKKALFPIFYVISMGLIGTETNAMKRIVLLSFVLLASCSPEAYIGMKQSDFKPNGYTSLYSATQTQTIYECCPANIQSNCMFYYFENGVLTRMDKGTPAPDLIIENRQR
ncbi:MAG: hypothetical protein ACLQQ4_11725 [Bacteroidia bacterium]